VAYRTDVNARDKGGAILAVAAVHALLLFALLNLSGTIKLADPQSALKVINLSDAPPPPPPAVVLPQPKPKQQEGGSAPKNIKSQATPVVAPKPKIETPPVQKIVASNTPHQGTAPTQGASDVAGPGTGAGGAGTGTGSGGGEPIGEVFGRELGGSRHRDRAEPNEAKQADPPGRYPRKLQENPVSGTDSKLMKETGRASKLGA